MNRNIHDFDESLTPVVRIEAVNVWHPRWSDVLESIDNLGQREDLHLEPDGWLSARRVLLVAFVEGAFAGHVSFCVHPVARDCGRPGVGAVLESAGVAWGFDEEEVGRELRAAARRRARSLGCTRLVGFAHAAQADLSCCCGG